MKLDQLGADDAESIISLSLSFSSGPPKMTSMPFLARARISGSDRPKCSATSLYSFDSGLPKTPTSSVYNIPCQRAVKPLWN